MNSQYRASIDPMWEPKISLSLSMVQAEDTILYWFACMSLAVWRVQEKCRVGVVVVVRSVNRF